MRERIKITAKKPLSIQENSAPHKQKTGFRSQSSHVDRILFLQRTIGNQAVQRLIKSGALQAKLRIGQPGDIYEQEADLVADAVMRMPEPQVVTRQAGGSSIEPECFDCEAEKLRRQPEEEEEELILPKPLIEQITPVVQRQVEEEEEEEELLQTKEISGQNTETAPDLESRINAIRGGGRPLAESERSFFEPRFGYDFSRVRLHSNPDATQMARAMNAKAFTTGQDIVFGVGQYIPETSTGKKLIAHELTHVVQQSGNEVRPKLTVNALNDRYEQKVGRVPQENRRTLRPLGERIKTSLNKMSLTYIQCERLRQCDPTPGFPTQNPQEVRRAHQKAIETLRRAYQRSQHPAFSDVQTAASNWFGITNFHTSSGLIRSNWQIVIDSIRRLNRRASRSIYHCHTTQKGMCRPPNRYAWTGLARIHICPYWWTSMNFNNRVRGLIHEWAHRWIRVGSEHGVYGQAAILNIPRVRRRTRIADAYAGYIFEFYSP